MLTVFKFNDLDPLTLWARRFDEIHVRLLGYTDAENQALKKTIERDYLECGCRAGRTALVVAIAGVLTYCVFLGGPLKTWRSETWIIQVSVIVLLTMVVKLLAIIRARLRLTALIRGIQAG